MRNLGSKSFVVHQEQVDLPYVVDKEFFEAVGEKMSCLLVASVTDLGLGSIGIYMG